MPDTYPQYYWLIDHETRITVIEIRDLAGYLEVTYLVQKANSECTHEELPGLCLAIEGTTEQIYKQLNQHRNRDMS
jgi:hypothetical protein